MNLPEHLDLKTLVNIYLISNTPRFLYKLLRENQSVQWIAQNIPLEDILNLYRERLSKKDRTVEDISLAYAAFVSLSLKDYSESRSRIEELGTEGLEWGGDIKQIIVATSIPTNVAAAHMPSLLKANVESPFIVASSNSVDSAKIIRPIGR